jgi:integrase
MATINSRTRGGKKVWLAQIRLKGLKPVSRQFDDKKAAQAWADDEEAKLDKLRAVAGVAPEVGTLTVKELVDRHLKDPKTKALDSYPQRVMQLGHWVANYGSLRTRQFGPAQILDCRDSLLESGLTPATTNRYVAAMRRAWNWGRNVRLIDSGTSWPGEVMLDENNIRTRFLTDEELPSIIDAAEASSSTMHAAVVVTLGTGLRVSELLRLEWRDVSFEREALTIREAKNETPRSVHLPSSAAVVLRALKKGTVVGRRVFLNEIGEPLTYDELDSAWQDIKAAAKVTDCRWHDLRHSCASYLAQSGASLLEIASVLGHKSLQATQRYAHLIPGAKVTGHDKLNAKLRGKP